MVVQFQGRGGSAETFLVQALSGSYAGVFFALKAFRRWTRPAWRESFLQEIAFLRTCNHPAVMRVFDEGIYQDSPFVIADYLPITLAHVMRRPLSVVEKLGYAVQLLSALEYLASPDRFVVHRDIKPQNIFVRDHACILGDFGLVKHCPPLSESDREMLRTSSGPRMPRHYRTPDLVDYLRGGAAPTPKSDVFQLGLVLAELFAGHNPQRPGRFDADVQLDSIRYIPGKLGKSIRGLIERMLEFNRATRPAAADLRRPWLELFESAAAHMASLEGRVFL
jgi:serine/threonine-protein kinase